LIPSGRAALNNLASYSPGRGVEAVRRDLGSSTRVIKLASNEGPYGPLAIAEKAMRDCLRQANRYPEAGSRSLRDALAERHGVPSDRVFVGAGLSAIIHHLAVGFLEPGDEVAFCSPTFTAYKLETVKMGARPVEVPLTASGACDVEALAAAVTARTKLVYVTSPNNPTGNIVTRSDLGRFLDRIPDHVLVVLDEAYFEYVEHPDYPDSIREFAGAERGLVVMRTFSKIYGLAGLRVGYAICPPEVARTCSKVQNPYEVNMVALATARASLDDDAELKLRKVENRTNRERLVAGLRALDHETLPSEGNFVRIQVREAASVASALERSGIIIRPLNSMGDPAGVRVTVGTAEEIDAFLTAFGRLPSELTG
jgi:histidinol-phosphate aminotransferase